MMKSFLCVCAAVLLFSSCSTHDAPTAPSTPQVSHGLYILNEGNFQRGNASLSSYDADSDRVTADMFRLVNGRGLGDTGNSLTIHDGKLFIVVNGSNRIEIVDLKSCASITTVDCPSGASPRNIVFSSDGVGYITNLYANSVSVFDPVTRTITGSIGVGPNPEGALAANGYVFVANSGLGNGNTVSVISTGNHSIAATLSVGDNPTAIAAASASTALVLCSGAYNDFQDPNDDTPGELYLINTATPALVDSISLGGHPQRLAIDGNGIAYTVQSDGIQRVNILSRTCTNRFIPGSFYAVACDPSRNRLYTTKPLDYLQPGTLELYTISGQHIASHPVGIIPGSMAIIP